jgi:methionyl aminopeptidase
MNNATKIVILKTKKELDIMRDSGYIAGNALNEIKLSTKPGVTTKYLNDKAERIIRQHKAIPAFLGYNNFPFTICASINEEIIHGLPSDRELVEGDILSVDLGAIYKGWYSDTAITIPVGKISQLAKKLVSVTKECLHKAIEKAVSNGRLGDISNTVQTHVESNGFNVVKNFGGHGIGRELHEKPQILNYGKMGSGIILKVGMVIAIEPMVTEKDPANKITKRGWTIETKDGGLAAHFEHTVAITENGPEILTKRS